MGQLLHSGSGFGGGGLPPDFFPFFDGFFFDGFFGSGGGGGGGGGAFCAGASQLGWTLEGVRSFGRGRGLQDGQQWS